MVRSKTNQKLVKGHIGLRKGEDMISGLPDPVLHHILSFLPIKSVVCTSILSKRWRYIWTTTPNLNFLQWRSPTTDDIQLETKRFMNFMDKMLFSRDTRDIQKFALKCDELCDESRINGWVSTVIRHNIEELNLNVKVKEPFYIPLSLFTCGSLIELELQIYSGIRLPKSISFPKLKTLRLFDVTFVDEDLTKGLFHSCPVLEELILCGCTWLNIQNISISAPKLKCLFIDGPNMVNADGLQYCKIKIHAPSLVSLIYKGSVAKEYVLSSFSTLFEVEIAFVIEEKPSEKRQREIGYSSSKLLGRLSDAKSLIVSGEALEALSYANDISIDLPAFHNLIHFGVTSKFQYSADSVLFNLLRTAPYLESVVFDKVFQQCLSTNDDVWTVNIVTGCLFLHLKSVNFKNFSGGTREMELAKLLLKNAISLEKMTIRCSAGLKEILTVKVAVMQHLLMVSRSSTSCEIDFS